MPLAPAQIGLLILAAVAGFAPFVDQGDQHAASPFGWWHVALVHGLASLWLSWHVSAAIAATVSPKAHRSAGLAALAVGVGFALATWVWAGGVGPELDSLGLGFWGRAIVRTLWCLALELPICLAAHLLGPPAADSPDDRRPALAALAMAVAVLLPLAYVSDEVGKQSSAAIGQLVQEGRLTEARGQLSALVDLGSSEPILDKSPLRLRDSLDRQLAELQQLVAEPLPADAPAAERLEYSTSLAVLGRRDEARNVLLKLAQTEPTAALTMGALLQHDERWDESDRWYRHARQLLSRFEANSQVAGQVRVIDGLAYNARGAGRPKDAEHVYREGLANKNLRSRAAYIRLQLGRHYHLGGRPADALRELQLVTQDSTSEFAAPARALIDDIRLTSPACVLSPPVVLEQIR